MTIILFVAACLRIVRATLFSPSVASPCSQQPVARLVASSVGKVGGSQLNRSGNVHSPVSSPSATGRCTGGFANIRVRHVLLFLIMWVSACGLARKAMYTVFQKGSQVVQKQALGEMGTWTVSWWPVMWPGTKIIRIW